MRLVPAHADPVTTQIHVVPMAGVALDFASMIRTCPLAWTHAPAPNHPHAPHPLIDHIVIVGGLPSAAAAAGARRRAAPRCVALPPGASPTAALPALPWRASG